MYISTGKLIYDPQARPDLPLGKWWLMLKCCPDLARYYLSMFNWANRANFLIQKNAWGSHISVIRGEEPKNKEFWKENFGKLVTFKYTGEIKTNNIYCWLSIECEEVLDIREKLGLPKYPVFGLHLTLGKRIGYKDGK
jgi:hypothetical protein